MSAPRFAAPLPRRILARLLPLLALLSMLLSPAAALADGIIIIEPPCPEPLVPPCRDCPPACPTPVPVGDVLDIIYHRVRVTIERQAAVTRVEQVFHNPNPWEAEGIYIFPIPADAAVSDFAMWVDGQRIPAEILDAEEAREIYDDIVRRRRDPALLEYAGRGAVQASIFPIPPGGERKVELEYAQVLTAESGLVRYVYPLSTEKYSRQPLQEVSISVEVVSAEAVRAVYSPTHPVAVDRQGDFRFSAGYEDANVIPDTDFELFYSVAQEGIGLNLLTYRDPAEGDGFFLLLAAPGIDVDSARVVAKDVVLVLDQSGSMEGEKFRQAQDALVYVLDHLNAEDRFNVISFSTGTQHYARGLRPAREAAEAARWVQRLSAAGGTNINLALLEALDLAGERPLILIFLTDGLATEGVTNTGQILANVGQAAPANVRLFTFGVGDDVDTILLDTLAQENHGASAYVRPGERIDEAVSGFYAKVQTPVLSDIALDFGNVLVSDTYPNPLPDLFAGSQLVLSGRYRAGGGGTVTLTGRVNGQLQVFEYPDQTFRSVGGPAFIPRLWATRKIGYLLNQIRLHGEQREWVDQIVTLSVRYGIVTPYTSYLITEEDILTEAGRGAVAENEFYQLQAAPAAPASGGAAVDRALGQGALEGAEVAAAPAAEAGEVVKIVGSRTFLRVDGAWVDTTFDPSRMTATRVQFASDDYFALIGARPDLGAAFALGPQVIALADGVAYEVVLEGAPPLALPLPATAEPAPTGGVPTGAPLATLAPAGTPVAGGPSLATPVPVIPGGPAPAPQMGWGVWLAAAVAAGAIGLGLALRRK